jgi:hypothetical protein
MSVLNLSWQSRPCHLKRGVRTDPVETGVEAADLRPVLKQQRTAISSPYSVCSAAPTQPCMHNILLTLSPSHSFVCRCSGVNSCAPRRPDGSRFRLPDCGIVVIPTFRNICTLCASPAAVSFGAKWYAGAQVNDGASRFGTDGIDGTATMSTSRRCQLSVASACASVSSGRTFTVSVPPVAQLMRGSSQSTRWAEDHFPAGIGSKRTR